MRRIKTVLAVFASVFVLGIAGAPVAQATDHALTCRSYFGPGSTTLRVCTVIGEDSSNHYEGIARFARLSGTNTTTVEIDTVRLLRNGNINQANPNNVTVTVTPLGYTRTTAQTNPCPAPANWKAQVVFRYKIGSSAWSTWVTQTSVVWASTGQCN